MQDTLVDKNSPADRFYDARLRIGMLFHVLSIYPKSVAKSAACMVVAAVCEGLGITALLPMLGLAMNEGQGGADSNQITKLIYGIFAKIDVTPSLEALLIFIVCMFVVKVSVTLLATYQISHAQAMVTAETRLALLGALLRSRWAFFSSQAIGQIANVLGQEVQRSSRAYFILCTIISVTLQSVAYLVGAALISWETTVGALAVGGLTFLLLGSMIARTKDLARHRTNLMKSFTHNLVDSLNGMKPLKAMGAIDLYEARLNEEISRIKEVSARSTFLMRSMAPFQEMVRMIAVAILIYVFLVVVEMRIDAALVITFLFLRLTQSVGELQRQWQVVAGVEYPYRYIKSVLDSARDARETYGGSNAPDLSDGIIFDNVTFSYGDKNVFSKISFKLPARQFTCFYGPSGSGKTTLIDLIIGLLKPTEGHISIDDTPLNDVDPLAWRRTIGYVPQESFLLNGSVFENISLGEKPIGRDAVKEALIRSDAWSFVELLPEGMDSDVGERGGKLSGGQRQRIAIARALVRKPKILILDEATSALDEEAEKSIAETLVHLAGGITIISITHRSHLVSVSDLAIRVEGGVFTEISQGEVGAVAS